MFFHRNFGLAGVVTTIDARAFESTVALHAESYMQLALADRLLLTKTDLVSEGQIASVRAAVNALEEDIVLGVLHPRERLIEDDLCERFGLKRHAARMVLKELQLQGLIEHRKNIGALVMSYSAQEVLDLYAVREILEMNAARLIPTPVAPEKLDILVEVQSRHDAAVKQADLRAVYRANLDFHDALFALSENKVLTEAIKEFERRTHAIRFSSIIFPDYLNNVRREHHQMIEALRAGDRKTLVTLCRDHLRPARDAYLETYHRQQNRRPATPASSGP